MYKHFYLYDFLSVLESPLAPWGISPVGSPVGKPTGPPAMGALGAIPTPL